MDPSYLVRLAGIEPTTPWFVAKYSIQLSYSREKQNYSSKFLPLGSPCREISWICRIITKKLPAPSLPTKLIRTLAQHAGDDRISLGGYDGDSPPPNPAPCPTTPLPT